MKKSLPLTTIAVVIFLLSFNNIHAFKSDSVRVMSWQEIMDSTIAARNSKNLKQILKWDYKAEANAREFFGDADTNYTSVIEDIKRVYYYLGLLDSAIKYGSIQVASNRKIYKEDNIYLVRSISWLAFFYNSKFEYAKALPLNVEALDMMRRLNDVKKFELITCINNVGDNYHRVGEDKKAEPYYIESLEESRKLYNSDNPVLVENISGVGTFYLEIREFDKSEPYYIEALEMNRRLYKTDNFEIAKSIYNLGTLYKGKNEFYKVDSLYDEALAMVRRVFKTNHLELARMINNVGSYYSEQNNYSKALTLLTEANGLFRNLYKYDQMDLSANINNLGNIYHCIGDFANAEKFYIESLEMMRRIYKNDSPDLALPISNMASFLLERGEYTRAEELFAEALKIHRNLYNYDNPDLAHSINKMGGFYFSIGDLRRAEPYLQESFEMRKRLYKTDHQQLASSIEFMAAYYNEIGNYEKAEPLYVESLEMLRRLYKTDNNHLALGINNNGAFYVYQNKFDKAEALFKESLEMQRRLHKTDHNHLALALNNLAFCYSKKRDYEKAEPLFKEAYEMNKNIYKNAHPHLAVSLSNLAFLSYNTGKYSIAGQYFAENLEMNRKLYKSDNFDLAKSIGYMADYDYYNGKFDNAGTLYKESLEMYKKIYNNQSVNLSESEKEKFWNTIKSKFESFYSFVINRSVDSPEILGYSFDNLLFTKALLFNSVNKIKKRILESGDSTLISKFRELSSKKELLIKLYSLPSEDIKKQGYNIDSIESNANNLEKELSIKSENFKQSYEKKKVSWKTIQAILKPDEAAIEMVRFRLHRDFEFSDTVYYAAFIITDQSQDNPDIVLLKNGKELEEMFYSTYRNNIKLKAIDSESFKAFWKAIFDKTKDYKKIYFSPDGIYNKLNIGTLEVEPGKYLLDYQKIHQLNSTQDILLGYYSKQDEANVYSSAVLIGNPDFTLSQDKVKEKERSLLNTNDYIERGTSPSRSFVLTSLPGTEKEVDNIAKYLKSNKWEINKYTKVDAVKAAVKTVNNPRVLHIATHGLFLSDIKPEEKEIFGIDARRIIGNPLLRSGLFFAGASSNIDENFKPSGFDNGFLTAYEAMNLNLDKTELVVLSACETGLGEIKNGEGVYGLQRAFIQAGAKSIIMSLWSVSDEATQELMSTFYKEWLSGKTKRDAFRLAQMKLKEKYPAPYYWGAFVMVGE
jgi:CHAT domain-containing protein